MLSICALFCFVSCFACAQSNTSTLKNNYTKVDLGKLRWIEGNWRGSDSNGQNSFFERYHFSDDGKIEIDSFSDSTLSKIDSQSTIYFENGEIVHKNGSMIWTVSRLDESQIEFAPKEKATNSFVWVKESAAVWTARLTSKDSQGKPTEKIYRMERIKQ